MPNLIILTIQSLKEFELIADIIMVWSAVVVLTMLTTSLVLIVKHRKEHAAAKKNEKSLRQTLAGLELYFVIKDKKILDSKGNEISLLKGFACELAPVLSFKRLPDIALRVSLDCVRIAENGVQILVMKPFEGKMTFLANASQTADFILAQHPIMGCVNIPAKRKRAATGQSVTICQCVKKFGKGYYAFCQISD